MGEIIFFVDADVCIHSDAIGKVVNRFRDEASLDALIGAYDDRPQARDFISQYKNLLHCYVHRTSRQAAGSFWTGIGAIRRSVFLRFDGFDETFGRPSVEDIDMGLRMHREGCRIELDATVQGTHRKQYSFWSMLRVDIVDRGVPWMELILREGRMPNDLNLRWGQRLSVILVWLLVAKGISWLSGIHSPALLRSLVALAVLDVLAILLLNWKLYRFYHRRRGLWFALRVVPLNFLFHFYNGLSCCIGLLRHFARSMRAEPIPQPVVAARSSLDHPSAGS